jgi:hypothetical protein
MEAKSLENLFFKDLNEHQSISSSKIIDLYRELAAGVYLSEASSPPRFFGVV